MRLKEYEKITGLSRSILMYRFQNYDYSFITIKDYSGKKPWHHKSYFKYNIINPNFIHHVICKKSTNSRKRKVIGNYLYYHCCDCDGYFRRSDFYLDRKHKAGIRSKCKECDIAERIERKGYFKKYHSRYKQREYVKKKNQIYSRKQRKEGHRQLTDDYIKRQISRFKGIKYKDIKKEWISAYRESALEKRKKGFVYFISAGNEAIKIGYSRNGVEGRLKTMQTGNHLELKILAKISGGIKKEKYIHKILEEFHLYGEWFKFNDEICKFIIEEIEHADKK